MLVFHISYLVLFFTKILVVFHFIFELVIDQKIKSSIMNKQPVIEAIEKCINFVANKNSDLFEKPVKEQHPDIYPHYEKIIKQPMDICTIRNKKEKGLYKSFDSIDRDITLMYQNCIIFNSKGNCKNNRLLKIGRKCLEEWSQFKETLVDVDNCEDSIDESFDENEVPNWFPEIINFYCETSSKPENKWTVYTNIVKPIQKMIDDKGENNLSEGEKKFSEMKAHSGKNKALHDSFDKLFKKVADSENNFGWQYYESVTKEIGRSETLRINLRFKNLYEKVPEWFPEIINSYCEISPTWEFYTKIRDPIQDHIRTKNNKSEEEKKFLSLRNRSEYTTFQNSFDQLFMKVADSENNFLWEYKVIKKKSDKARSNFMIKLKFKEEFSNLNQNNKRANCHEEYTPQHLSTKSSDERIDDDDLKHTRKKLKKTINKEVAKIKISFEAQIMDLKKEIVELKQTNANMEKRLIETNRQNEQEFADMKKHIIATKQQLLVNVNQMQTFQNSLSRIENGNGSLHNFRDQKCYNNQTNPVGPMNFQTNPVGPMNFQTNPVGPMNFQTNPVGPMNFQTNPVGPMNFQRNSVGPNNQITF